MTSGRRGARDLGYAPERRARTPEARAAAHRRDGCGFHPCGARHGRDAAARRGIVGAGQQRRGRGRSPGVLPLQETRAILDVNYFGASRPHRLPCPRSSAGPDDLCPRTSVRALRHGVLRRQIRAGGVRRCLRIESKPWNVNVISIVPDRYAALGQGGGAPRPHGALVPTAWTAKMTASAGRHSAG